MTEENINNMSFFYIPWEQGDKPYFVNDEGFEWYIDKDITEYIMKKKGRKKTPLQKIGAIGFLVKKGNDISRVIIDNKQNILADSTSYESVLYKIDLLNFGLSK